MICVFRTCEYRCWDENNQDIQEMKEILSKYKILECKTILASGDEIYDGHHIPPMYVTIVTYDTDNRYYKRKKQWN